ncbi:hypothetical protein [Kordia jejudonensis]|uniref:hypothetical protein n=1 Tax=Kordia jejudonensis TaxID=1348245 RepID=UPI0006291D0C|nr:hypothetical protein [Kordia jejudonensis]
MKKQQKLLALQKTQIAKINSFQILAGDDIPFSSLECAEFKSRTPSGNQTQTFTNAIDCEATTASAGTTV